MSHQVLKKGWLLTPPRRRFDERKYILFVLFLHDPGSLASFLFGIWKHDKDVRCGGKEEGSVVHLMPHPYLEGMTR